MMGVVVTQGSSKLFGPTLTVRDNEAVDEALLNKISINRWEGSGPVPIQEVRTKELHRSD